MATLADSFLEDLDELEGSSEEEQEIEEEKNEEDKKSTLNSVENGAEMELDFAKADNQELDRLLSKAAQKGTHYGSKLRKKESYKTHLSKVRQYQTSSTPSLRKLDTEEEEYQLMVASNDLMVNVDDEIVAVHRMVVDVYSKKFPELESLVPNALDYVRVVKCIGNETDLTKIDLTQLLPSATVMGVSVTGSTTSGKPLSQEDLTTVIDGCDEAIALDEEKNTLLQFVEQRMIRLAPNTSALIGSRIAAQLIGLAGGLTELSRIPSCNIQVMGQQKRVLSGFSSASALKHTGHIFFSDIVQNTPPYLRMKACRAVAGKVTLAARVDSQQSSATEPNDDVGRRLREELVEKIEKWQEAPKAKTKKALPIPDEKPRRKRGGKRYRKMKERLQMTDMRKEMNRQTFVTANDEYGDNAMGVSYGRLGQEGSGNLRVVKKEQKQMAKKLKAASYGSGMTSGLTTSLAFTPVQGLELMNPEVAQERVRKANEKYFSHTSGFLSVKK